jgi:mannosyltransferase
MAGLAEREKTSADLPRGKLLAGLPRWLVIAVPALVAFVIDVAGLSGPSLWRDEAYTRDAINRSLPHLLSMLHHTDAVHGAYYVLMHFVCEIIGTSDFALRLPSVCAMAVATGFTAAVGRRSSMLAGLSGKWADATGLLAGLVFATTPYATYYAQTARPYAFVTMFAAIASYLLLRAWGDGGWRWWTGYAVAVGFTGLFNTFGLLIIPAHALTMLIVGARPGAGAGSSGLAEWLRRVAVPWLIAAVVAVIVLGPLLLLSFRQRGQISWLAKPDRHTVVVLVRDFAGSSKLFWPVALLALGGIAAGVPGLLNRLNRVERLDRVDRLDRGRMSPAAIALPWLVLPPVVLLAVSMIKPVYDFRYIEFCLPALAILVAAGLVGLVRVLLGTALRPVAWVPAAVVVAAIAVLLISPQHAIRQSSARPDNLRLASQIVAAHEQPGDVVFYIPLNMRVLGTGYPAPFRKLRDIALAESPIASHTLTGTEIGSATELASRFTDVNQVWIVTGEGSGKFPVPRTAEEREKLTLVSGMHIVHRWMAGDVMLTLYAR